MEGLKNKKKIILSILGIIVVIATVIVIGCYIYNKKVVVEDPLFKYSCIKHGKMDSEKFDTFLAKMSDQRRLLIMKAVDPNYSVSGKDKLTVVNDIRERFVRESSHWFTYKFKDKRTVHYDKTVRWVAKELGIQDKIKFLNTFKAEREIFVKLFEDVWNKMTPAQRQQALKNIKMDKKGNEIAGIASLSGSAALSLISATAAFSGFAFYTGMSSLIYSMSSVIGVTLPFAAYTGATTIAGILTGPVGWALIAVGTATGCALIGQADYQETAKMIVQIHFIKVDTIQKSRYDLNKFLAKSQRMK